MSEKYDGVRGYWDGNKMYSRHGKEIKLPKSLADSLPNNTILDGELWMGRGMFNKLNGILHSQPTEENWKDIKFMVFDLPSSQRTFSERMEELKELTKNLSRERIGVVEHKKCGEMKEL